MHPTLNAETLLDLPRTIVALDVGRSAVKAFALYRGEKSSLVFRSTVTKSKVMPDAESAAAISHETIMVGNTEYFTGEAARLHGEAESTVGLRNDWVDSPEYAALVLSAIKRFQLMGVGGLEDAYVVVGTPSDLYRSDKDNLHLITQQILGNNEVKVLSQPLGVYFSHVLHPNGKPVLALHRDELGNKKSWLVLEVGEYDTGFMLMREGAHQHERDSIAEGINRATRLLQDRLYQKKIRLNLLQCGDALRTGRIKFRGEVISVLDDVVSAVEPVATKIVEKAVYLFGNDIDLLDGILLAGGGSEIVHHRLKEQWGNVVLLSEPRMSVAEGYLRYAVSVISKRMRDNKTIMPVAENVH